jgi:hypothetical protein
MPSHLLAHDRGRDERQALDGGGHVAKRVELSVRRCDLGGLSDERDARLGEDLAELSQRQSDAEARDRLELVERAARMPEPATRDHGDVDAAGRHQWRDDETRLVADASRRVLVDLGAGQVGEVEDLPRPHHGFGEGDGLAIRHAAEVDGHGEGRRLVLGDLAGRVAPDEEADL